MPSPAANQKSLKKLKGSKVRIFKITNRVGYAAIAENNLTEGGSPAEAYDRMTKALKRSGFEVIGAAPKVSKHI
ncbi:MAG: hydroxyethylthiazole kinase-like sugar kinase family protein [Candidatus Omnitrophota bacterium]|jgi:hydroxyethylthiazole kinase-like sugar kinase family protein